MGSIVNLKRLGEILIRASGVVTTYNSRHFGKDRGQGLIHRDDVGCSAGITCGRREHLVRFSVFEVQYLGEIPQPGDKIKFEALPGIHAGDLPVVTRMRMDFGKSNNRSKMIPERVQYGI